MLVRGSRCRPVGQDSFAALAARSLLSVAGKRGGHVTTDSLFRSYRDSLDNEIAGAPNRVADIGSNGLPLGAALIGIPEFEERLGGSAAGAALQRDRGRGFPPDRVQALLSAERELLRVAGGMLRGSHDGALDPALPGLVQQIDYAWAHFPEYPDQPGGAPGPGFLARVRVAAGYYEQRLSRILSVV
jgi:hypothetical protein